jgi:hypothetical protein
MTLILKYCTRLEIPSLLYIVAVFAVFNYDCCVFIDCTRTIAQSWLSHSYFLSKLHIIIILECCINMEIPSKLCIVTSFTTFTYDYRVFNDYKMTTR